MMLIDNKFEIGETVYIKHDVDQVPRMLVGIHIFYDYLKYEVSDGPSSTTICDSIELSLEKII